MLFDEFKEQLPDVDPQETHEWNEAIDSVIDDKGMGRAQYLLYRLLKHARLHGVGLPPTVQTPYINTIPPEQEPWFPGDERLELRIRRIIRWNAAAMVTRANRRFPGLGGHLSTYASAASLYEVGFNHFFRGRDGNGSGDQIFFQGHAAPGIYARAFLEGYLTEEDLDHFRRQSGSSGLPSYPHPRSMHDFWEFPTVSMGLGPIQAIYQARFNRYLQARGIADTSNSRVWMFGGDGETDEPESLGALTLAAREGLDNLVFVINCNLQRLDGPVRGNGKIIQELESVFRGAGWNVLKVIWGRRWDDLLARDVDGLLVKKMTETLDGDYQRYAIESGDYIREHFFGPDPRLRKMVEHLADEDLPKLRRGGHDYRKLYAAYKVATGKTSAPTVILAKTVKGWTLGHGIASRNVTHQTKKMDEEELRAFRDLLELPIPDAKLKEGPYYHPGRKSEEAQYLLDRRQALGGCLPRRKGLSVQVELPGDDLFKEFREGGGKQEVSSTMAFVRLLRKLLKSDDLGPRIVPIIPDEARTFGMESLFREFKIYAALGQKYKPVDAEMLLSYTEGKDGQILEEGITEAGSISSFTAAGTSYATHGQPMIPFFIFYSMFGFQRVGDLIWSSADQRSRGFLLGATAGRTTLNGEGLQHQDGQSLLYSSVNPGCVSYDPAFAYEMATIIQEGLSRMYEKNEDVFYYLTLYNENYPMPPMPEGSREGILKGLYLFRAAEGGKKKHRARILGSGSILLQALRAQEILAERFDVAADVWSATSYTELQRDALQCERWNRLHPGSKRRVPYVAEVLKGFKGPTLAVSDFVKAIPSMVSPWVPGEYTVLGTDGFGRSNTREQLRRHFEIDAEQVVVSVLSSLARSGKIAPEVVVEAITEFGIDAEAPDPLFQ